MSIATVNKGRFGYHACDYETYRKLKYLHKRYWETVYAVARWRRWNNKTVYKSPQEPTYCPVFVEDGGSWVKFKNKEGFNCMKYVQKAVLDYGIIEAYKTARTPFATEEAVQSLNISVAKIESLYNKVREYYND